MEIYVMEKSIRLLAQYYDTTTDEVVEEAIIDDQEVLKAAVLGDLGYNHKQQVDYLQKIQDFKLMYQLQLSSPTICPKCQGGLSKHGVFDSKFHAVLTEHKAKLQRMSCKCGYKSPVSIDGMYGSSIHPDLLKKQAIQGAQLSYEKASRVLDAESVHKRSINSHSQIYKSVKLVSEPLEVVRKSSQPVVDEDASESLIANIDGGHIKSRGDACSFEAMIATVYRPENIKKVDKHHNLITKKSTVASAKSDKQQSMYALFKSACESQGMNKNTEVVCLANGAENCRSIAHSVEDYCKNVTYIIDWFHVGMKFKNYSSAVPEEHKVLYDNIKWNLWHGNADKALQRFDELKNLIDDKDVLAKLSKLYIYIKNNKAGIVNYEARRSSGLVFTSHLAESTVNSLINERKKGKQKMLWTRDGAHNVLQIRSSLNSKSWDSEWPKVENIIYKIAA
jgi:hypothetical protein